MVAHGFYGDDEMTEKVFKASYEGDEGKDWVRTGYHGFLYSEHLFVMGNIEVSHILPLLIGPLLRVITIFLECLIHFFIYLFVYLVRLGPSSSFFNFLGLVLFLPYPFSSSLSPPPPFLLIGRSFCERVPVLHARCFVRHPFCQSLPKMGYSGDWLFAARESRGNVCLR